MSLFAAVIEVHGEGAYVVGPFRSQERAERACDEIDQALSSTDMSMIPEAQPMLTVDQFLRRAER